MHLKTFMFEKSYISKDWRQVTSDVNKQLKKKQKNLKKSNPLDLNKVEQVVN